MTNIQEREKQVTVEDLVQRANNMIPWLREKADAVEKAGSIPRETIEAFKEAGFFKITQPAKWGGYEMNLEVFHRVLMEIGRGCPSSAWVLGILGVHSWEMGLIDSKAAEDVWGNDPDVLISSSYYPFGQAEKVEGGWLLNGKWLTSSGTDHAPWAFVGAYIRNEDGSMQDYKAFLVPDSEYTRVDDWEVFGLAGTGSKSLILDNVFVPDYRTHSLIEQPWSDRPSLYLLHQTFAFFSSVSAAVIGFAQGAIDYYIEHNKEKVILRNGGRATQNVYVKHRLGTANQKVRGARARLLQAVRDASVYVERGEQVPHGEMLQFLSDAMGSGQECSDAVLLLHRGESAQGVFLSNPLQRQLRDILAAANHGTQNADASAESIGSYLLGEGIAPMRFNVKGFPPESLESN